MVKFYITTWTVIWGYLWFMQTYNTYADIIDNIDLTTVDIIRKHEYPCEIYSNVATEDGYLLEIFRIPHGRKAVPNGTSRSPVVLMHGLIRSSRDWIVLGPQKGLGFLLADKGYDVWLPNSRETVYSRKHLTLNPETDRAFWNFSSHEIGYYDLAAIFELIRNVTRKERFSYIAVSEGTAEFYILASLRPEYNRNVTIMISLAPTAYMGHTSLLIRSTSALGSVMTNLAEAFGFTESITPPTAELARTIVKMFCTREGLFQNICFNLVSLVVGYDPTLNKSVLAVAAGVGAGGSFRQLSHSLQNVRSGLFRQYNYGREGNMEKYGTIEPPSYDLTKITAPIALFCSNGDEVSSPLDAERFCKDLPNCAYLYKVPDPHFNHLDFLIGKDVYNLVFRKIFYLLGKYDKINNT